MPHTDDYNKHEEHHAMDDGSTHERSFKDLALIFSIAIVLCILATFIFYLAYR